MSVHAAPAQGEGAAALNALISRGPRERALFDRIDQHMAALHGGHPPGDAYMHDDPIRPLNCDHAKPTAQRPHSNAASVRTEPADADVDAGCGGAAERKQEPTNVDSVGMHSNGCHALPAVVQSEHAVAEVNTERKLCGSDGDEKPLSDTAVAACATAGLLEPLPDRGADVVPVTDGASLTLPSPPQEQQAPCEAPVGQVAQERDGMLDECIPCTHMTLQEEIAALEHSAV